MFFILVWFGFFMLIFSYPNLLKDFPSIELPWYLCHKLIVHICLDIWALYSALIYVLILYVKNTITLYFVLAVGSESSRLTFVLQSSFGYS